MILLVGITTQTVHVTLAVAAGLGITATVGFWRFKAGFFLQDVPLAVLVNHGFM